MKRIITILMLAGSTLLLSACSAATNNDSLFHKSLVSPFAKAIKGIADITAGNYGIAIIIITILIRTILLPLTLKTYKNQQQMKSKMEVLKPEMDKIQKKLKAEKSPEKQRELQAEMMGLYKKHGVNPLNMGCLPILIQMPIWMGLYYAIRSSHEIATHNFLWFNLGQPDIPMAILAGIAYFFQSKVTMVGMTEEQQKQMKFMTLLSPIMILVISFSAPAALALYWAVGGVFLIAQTLIAKKIYNPKAEVKPSK
ncbi:membrane protein insertase YidC [Falsibacillus pallidus]|uniref:Membrane protein insertase YidC n=1 Tax=Falsibacillus pallidus TaxID=493781 RepID=A0A370GHB3_9BACI|nr:membrane protein insertase YidC [Falsibacillus pallidus]RDI43188.1 YidC/Oxa1 family membrane protein insertase [Falsibacillus pallidus]